MENKKIGLIKIEVNSSNRFKRFRFNLTQLLNQLKKRNILIKMIVKLQLLNLQ